MMKLCFFIFTYFLLIHNVLAQEFENRMQWWHDAKFGMFIHWGVYAVPAGQYNGKPIPIGSEWIMNRAKISVSDYKQYAKQFNPVKYNPESWVKMAKKAGMKYLVITAKHHDGFALFDSKASKWNVVAATPYGKDLLKPLAEACKKQGIRLGFYYSQAQDWNNPGGAAARRLASSSQGPTNPDSVRIDAFTAANEGHWDPAQLTSTMGEYIDSVAVPQVRELLTNYGEVSVLWWDTPENMTDGYAEKLQAQLHVQPQIITNNRLKFPNFPGDFDTPEQEIPKDKLKDGRDWESCMTMNENWGFKSSDNKWESPQTIVRNLCDVVSKGGNFLLNVGPTADGLFPEPSVQILHEVGKWMKTNGEAIYGTQASPLDSLSWGRCSRKEANGKTIYYFYVFDWPVNGKLTVPGFHQPIISAGLLSGKKKLKTQSAGPGLEISLPKKTPNNIIPVIKVITE